MSRHRNIRSLDVEEEYDGYYSCYGQSMEDDFCISPSTEAQFLYNRSKNESIGSFLGQSVTEEDDEEMHTDDSLSFQDLNPTEKAKLQSCVEAMQDVVGEAVSEEILKKAAVDNNFDLESALNAILSEKAPKPQRKAPELLPSKEKKSKTICPEVKKDPVSSNNMELNTLKNTTELKKDISTELSKVRLSQDVLITEKTEKKKEKEENQKSGLKDIISTELSSKVQLSQDVSITEKTEKKKEEEEDQKSGLKPVKQLQNVNDIYKKERGSEKPLMNLVVIGHVDAGKSTLMGHLLYRLGQVSKKTMHKFEQDSKKLGKSSFMYAWVLDETAEERNRGITMDVAQSRFETTNRSVVLLDAPGHKDFIPNMITGAAQADVAILVVDSTRGEFETGFEAGGQTREHTVLIRSLGVSQVAIAVNKMDNVSWSEERFKEIKSKLILFFKTVGFKENDLVFVPCSGLTGENLTSSPVTPELQNWYKGPTLVDVIDNFQPPERSVEKPLRMCISDVFKGISGGFCLAGKIESGYLKTGDKIMVLPAGEQGTVKGITMDENPVQHAFAGDQVVLQVNAIDINNVSTGSMVCDIDSPAKVTTIFEARLVIFNVPIPITKGFPVILHYQSVSEQANIKNLLSQLNRSTGEVIKKKPRCLTKNSSAVVEIEVNRPICIELFKDFKDLGRFMLRYAGTTIAAGLVTNIK